MMGDSTRVESPGYTPSERVINDSFDKIFANAPGRVIIATFASLLSRVQQVIDTASRYERVVALVGRSMVNNVQMAIDLEYLNIPKAMLIRAEDINKFPPERVVIICTGSQGEPTSALTRIANQDHRLVRIQKGDWVFSRLHLYQVTRKWSTALSITCSAREPRYIIRQSPMCMFQVMLLRKS